MTDEKEMERLRLLERKKLKETELLVCLTYKKATDEQILDIMKVALECDSFLGSAALFKMVMERLVDPQPVEDSIPLRTKLLPLWVQITTKWGDR